MSRSTLISCDFQLKIKTLLLQGSCFIWPCCVFISFQVIITLSSRRSLSSTIIVMGDFSILECFRTFLRVILIVVNSIVALLGLLVLIFGIWSAVEGNKYVQVAPDQPVYAVPVLMIVAGIFVILLGIVGIVGALFAHTIIGRIILGLYGFVLALVVIIEIAGGIAAGVERNYIHSGFETGINETFAKYYSDASIQQFFDDIQRGLQCCGTTNFNAYQNQFGNNSIPQSCCSNTPPQCDLNNPDNIFPEGCSQKIIDIVSNYIGVIAGVAITFGLLQIIGVVASCFVAIAGGRKEGKYQVV